jgi:hypothetical protein
MFLQFSRFFCQKYGINSIKFNFFFKSLDGSILVNTYFNTKQNSKDSFVLELSPLVFRPTYLFRKRWLPTKFPLLLARRRARADSFENIRSYQENLHSCFSSESSVPRALADRFVRVKSIYYLVPGIFLFDETLWMVCCIVSVWKV